MTDYKLKTKIDGKFFTVGNLKENQWGNLQAGIKVTPEFKKLVEANEGGWINLGAWANDEKPKQAPSYSLDEDAPF